MPLAVFDEPARGGNSDGVINSKDAVFKSLLLWQDRNHNGISEPGELHTLPSLGIAQIDLKYETSKRVDEFGNRFRYRARVLGTAESDPGHFAWDVFPVVGN